MDVLLKETVDNVGEKDDLISVKNGFGRNYLIPQGKAILATESVKKMHAETLRQRSHKATKVLGEAKAQAEKMADIAGDIIRLIRHDIIGLTFRAPPFNREIPHEKYFQMSCQMVTFQTDESLRKHDFLFLQ